MSNLVFPAFAPPHWSWRYPLKKTPSYNTTIQTPTSGRGQLRISSMQFPIWHFVYDLSYIKGDAQNGSDSAWQNLLGFFMSAQGAAGDWLFSDPFDKTVPTTAQQTIGTGDGTTKQFLFYRQFSGGGIDIIQNFQSAPNVYLNGSLQSSSNYTIDQFGNLVFNTAPGAAVTISWAGSFYFRCRFEADSWDNLEETLYQVWELAELRFESVIL